ncbi:hypothetical protein DRP43_01805, partial [candidate division TA06 bacterium]
MPQKARKCEIWKPLQYIIFPAPLREGIKGRGEFCDLRFTSFILVIYVNIIYIEHKMSYDTIIIGAGAAGLFTAINIKKGSVLILEKNFSAGKKILISGGSKCNFTNSESKEELLKHYYEHGNFLKHAIYNYSNRDIINYFGEMGIDTKIDEQGRVFPQSEKSTDILKALLYNC